MTDLRPPAFKKHADAVLFLYREALYDLNIKNNVLEVIVHKNATSWPTGTVRLGWDPKSLRIDEIKEERV